MKRIIAIILAALFVVVMLASCGAKGKYVISKVNDESVDEYLDRWKEYGLDFTAEEFLTIELKNGGKALVTSFGEEEEGTWKQKGSKVTITIDGEDSEFTLKGKELKGKGVDGNSITLKKK